MILGSQNVQKKKPKNSHILKKKMDESNKIIIKYEIQMVQKKANNSHIKSNKKVQHIYKVNISTLKKESKLTEVARVTQYTILTRKIAFFMKMECR